MVVEPKIFGRLFLAEKDIVVYEDLVLVSRRVDPQAFSK